MDRPPIHIPRPLARRAARAALMSLAFFFVFFSGRISGAAGLFCLYGALSLACCLWAAIQVVASQTPALQVLCGQCQAVNTVTISKKGRGEITIMDGRQGPVTLDLPLRRASFFKKGHWYRLYLYPAPTRRAVHMLWATERLSYDIADQPAGEKRDVYDG